MGHGQSGLNRMRTKLHRNRIGQPQLKPLVSFGSLQLSVHFPHVAHHARIIGGWQEKLYVILRQDAEVKELKEFTNEEKCG